MPFVRMDALVAGPDRLDVQKRALYRRIAELAHAYARTEPRNVLRHAHRERVDRLVTR